MREDDFYVQIMETIGELSWGIDIPSPIVLTYMEGVSGDVKQVAVNPVSMEPVFDAIYRRMKSNPCGNLLETERRMNLDAEQRIQELKAAIKVFLEMSEYDRERTSAEYVLQLVLEES